MDVLSDVIATMRTGMPSVGRARVDGGGCRFPAYDGTGFHIMLEGRCWLLPADGEPRVLGAGDVVLFPRGREHALAFTDTAPPSPSDVPLFPEWDPAFAAQATTGAGAGTAVLCGKYRREGARAHPLLHEMPEVLHVPSSRGRHAELRAAVDLLARETGAPRPGGQSLVPSLLDAVFVYLVRAWLDDGPAITADAGWRRALTDDICTAALDAMHGDPARPWTLHDLGRAAGVSRATLVRRFTTLAGQSPMTYLAWWRMLTAARLLRASDAPLAEIAAQVGYGSAFAFSHAFKREFGQSPTHYRAERVVSV